MTRRLAAGIAAALLLLPEGAACSDDDGEGSDGGRLPPEPAACAGPARESLADVRAESWRGAIALLEDEPSARVWLTFSRTLSAGEVGELLDPLVVHLVLLVDEQPAGGYAKTQGTVPDARASAPAVADAAERWHRHPGEPPIAGLIVSGDVAAVLDREPCLIHAMTVGVVGPEPPISPAIEPDVLLIDPG